MLVESAAGGFGRIARPRREALAAVLATGPDSVLLFGEGGVDRLACRPEAAPCGAMGGNGPAARAAGRWARRFEDALFRHRPLAIAVFALASLGLALSATRLEIDAGFEKHLPGNHPFMRVFIENRAEFGGANRLLIAVPRAPATSLPRRSWRRSRR